MVSHARSLLAHFRLRYHYFLDVTGSLYPRTSSESGCAATDSSSTVSLSENTVIFTVRGMQPNHAIPRGRADRHGRSIVALKTTWLEGRCIDADAMYTALAETGEVPLSVGPMAIVTLTAASSGAAGLRCPARPSGRHRCWYLDGQRRAVRSPRR